MIKMLDLINIKKRISENYYEPIRKVEDWEELADRLKEISGLLYDAGDILYTYNKNQLAKRCLKLKSLVEGFSDEVRNLKN